MDKCPNCGGELETDYDANEEPYLACTQPDCNWYEEAEDEEVEDEVNDA